jgi:hypothetical protein
VRPRKESNGIIKVNPEILNNDKEDRCYPVSALGRAFGRRKEEPCVADRLSVASRPLFDHRPMWTIGGMVTDTKPVLVRYPRILLRDKPYNLGEEEGYGL